MMSGWVQMLLGFLPAWIISVVIIVATKGKKPQWIATLALLTVIGGGAVWSVQSEILNIGTFETKVDERETEKISTATSREFLAAAYSFMEQGFNDAADRTLDEYLEYHPYTADYALAAARLNVLRGDIMAASGLYEVSKEMGGGSNREEETVRAVVDGSQSFVLWQEAAELVKDAIDGLAREYNRDAAEAAIMAIDVQNIFADFTSMPANEREEFTQEVKNWVDRLEAEYTSIPEIRDAVTRANVINGNYKNIIKSLDEGDDVDGLLITAELIRNGLITSDEVLHSKEFSQSRKSSDMVEEWIETQLSENEFSAGEQKVLEEFLEELKEPDKSSSPAVRWIERRMTQYITNCDDRENSKLYLELARLSFETGDRDHAAAYLEQALGEMGNSEDPDYSGAAGALLDVIRNPKDTESLKNVADYTEALTDSMLPDGTKKIIEQQKTEQEANREDPDDEDPGSSGFGSGFEQDLIDNIEQNTTGTMNETFEQYITDTINQSTGSVNIVSVDASGFDTVVAIAAVDESIADTAELFKQNFRLLDCSIEIDDFDVERVSYNEINIVLVCDNSGSMGGTKIENLKSALNTFTDISGETNIAIVPFSSGVLSDNVRPFGSTAEGLKAGVESMLASGGTNIYSAVNYALELFPEKQDALNVMILMSDGQDNTPSNSAMLDMTAACQKKNASIYSMGLGSDVNSNVMNTYAAIGGGSYMYVSDSDSLLSFYEYIYALCTNRYRITYTAADTVKASRTMELEGINTVTAYDEHTYYLYKDGVSGEDLGEEYQITTGKAVLNGLENRLFYRSSLTQTTYLLGSGFEKEDSVSIELHGGVKYTLETEFVDSGHIKVTVPSNVACGVYDVYVTYNGRRSVFASGFVMTSNNRHVLRFGDYVFTATELASAGNTMTLGGVVNMNEWLGFTGTVTITGNIEKDSSVYLSYDKAYLQYADNGTSKGLAKYMAQNGYSLSMPGVSSLRLYNDPTIVSTSDNYPVDKAYIRGISVRIVDFIGLNGVGLSLYPNRMVIDFEAFDTKFPFQDAMVKAIGADDLFSFKADHTEKIVFTNNEIGADISIELGQNSRKTYTGKLGNLNVYYKDATLKLDVNTIEGDISIKVQTDVAFLTDGLGVEIGWKDWKFDSVKMYADKDINTYIGNVPVTFDDFSLGISDLSKNDNYNLGTILTSTWTGSFDCSMAKLSAVFPSMKGILDADFIKDAAVAKLDDTTVTFKPRDFYISVSTKLNLLGLVDVGSCSLELGEGISYTNLLLGMEGTSVNGIVGKLTLGLDIDTNNFDLKTQGTLEAALTNKVVGIRAIGSIDAEISWWVFSKDYFAHGEFFLGVYQKHNGEWQFAVYAAGLTSDGGSMNPICWPSEALSCSSL